MVFPARAGMNRGAHLLATYSHRVPRTRGDEVVGRFPVGCLDWAFRGLCSCVDGPLNP